MDETKALESVVTQHIEDLLNVFINNLIAAKGDVAKVQQAENTLKNGLEFFRRAYDKAKPLLK